MLLVRLIIRERNWITWYFVSAFLQYIQKTPEFIKMLGHYINMEYIQSLGFTRYTNQKNLGGGVYRFFDADRKVIYVGKSNELDKRLRRHLGGKSHTKHFIRKVKYVDFYIEPLYESLLESILIAYFKPYYNQEIRKGWKNRKRRR
jgi:predicted GIY-YIG superfamily endonuclease